MGFPQKWYGPSEPWAGADPNTTTPTLTLTLTLSRYGPSEPWVEAVKVAAADLFELLAAVVER